MPGLQLVYCLGFWLQDLWGWTLLEEVGHWGGLEVIAQSHLFPVCSLLADASVSLGLPLLPGTSLPWGTEAWNREPE